MKKRSMIGAFALSGLLLSSPLIAADLKVGIVRGSTSVDPHFTTSIVNYETNASIFEPLVRTSNDGKMGPWLAKSWKVLDDTTWEFKLQEGVKWHDGKPFTGEDVAFTYKRARNVPGSLSSLATYLRQVKEVKVIDPTTIQIITDGPAPTLLNNLMSVLIVSKHAGENATSEDYHSGKATIGTGPYKFSSWISNDTVIVAKNDNYWGKKPEWDKITYVAMPNTAARLAAVRSGDIDVALSIPPQEVASLKSNPNVSVFGGDTNRMMYAAFDTGEDTLKSLRISGPNGEKLDKNPLADSKIRQALRLAIDLQAIKDKVYLGYANFSGQLLQKQMFGFMPDVKPWSMDVAKANQLVKDSGWAGKFKMAIVTSDTNFPLAVELSQALAQLWTRAGIPTSVVALQQTVWIQQRNDGQVPVLLSTWTNPAGSAEDFFPPVVHTRDTKAGWGVMNQTNYSRKTVDELIEKGLTTMDNAKREDMFRQAGKITYDDAEIIPLVSVFQMHAVKKGLEYIPRNDGFTLDYNIRPASATTAKN